MQSKAFLWYVAGLAVFLLICFVIYKIIVNIANSVTSTPNKRVI